MSGRQCVKRLWFEVNQPLTLAVPPSVPMLQGRAFDELVQQLEPGIIISRVRGMPAAIAETRRIMQAGGAPVIYQAAFRNGNLAVIADILRRRGARTELVEVKASTSVKAEHVPDVAFQTLVLRGAQQPVEAVFIGHVDNSFVLQRPGEFAGIKVEQEVTVEVEDRLPAIAEQALELLAVMASHQVPDISMGAQCTSPYECPFIARFSSERGPGPEYPVELLPRGAQRAAELRAEGYEDLRQVPADKLSNEQHRRVHAATLSGVPFLDPAAAYLLNALPYPRSYLDFETMAFVVPEVIGTRPYEQWPFQFSLHIEESAGQVRHVEHLEIDRFGEFERIADALLVALPLTGPVFVYNATLEAGVIKRLAARLPTQRAALNAILERLFDLWPLTQQSYYHPAMRGSWSIKKVLPTIDATLAYENLGEIGAGDAAQQAFLEWRDPKTPIERRQALAEGLKRYCERDTWAMVVLRRFLSGEGAGAEAA
jgi:hypothetical protein